MSDGKHIFFIKVAIAIVVIIVGVTVAGMTFQTTQDRFGGVGTIHWIIGLLAAGLGVIALWAGVISVLDRRALTRYRAEPGGAFADGQVVALSGILRTEGEALIAPFSKTACAAYSYDLIGRARATGSSDSGERSQLCMSGAHLAPAVLETSSGEYRLLALPDVDTDFRENALGGEWGDLGTEMIQAASESAGALDVPDVQGRLADVKKHADPPLAEDLFITTSYMSAASLTVNEDAVPVGEQVTLLGTYVAGDPGLDGRRMGGLKAFKGDLDERIVALGSEIGTSLKVGLPSLVIGVGLMTLAMWWP